MCKSKGLYMATEGKPPRAVIVYYWGYLDQLPEGTRPINQRDRG